MTLSLDGAIQRLQAIALASTDLTIKSAPNYPVEDAGMLPLSIAHLNSSTFFMEESSTIRILSIVFVDVHFSLNTLTDAYTRANLFAMEYMRRLGGDPTLNAKTDTIDYLNARHDVFVSEWNGLATLCVRFTVPLKFRLTPLTTA